MSLLLLLLLLQTSLPDELEWSPMMDSSLGSSLKIIHKTHSGRPCNHNNNNNNNKNKTNPDHSIFSSSCRQVLSNKTTSPQLSRAFPWLVMMGLWSCSSCVSFILESCSRRFWLFHMLYFTLATQFPATSNKYTIIHWMPEITQLWMNLI